MPKGQRRVKPAEYFPATPRADGRYQKRINGHLFYFGGAGIPREQAIADYERVRDQLYAGAPSPVVATGRYEGMTIREAINTYLNARKIEVEAGTLRKVSYADLRACLLSFGLHVGNHLPFTHLRPDVFTSAAIHFAKTQSACRFNHVVAAVNAWLAYASSHDWIDAIPKRGPRWVKFPRRELGRRDRIITKAEFHALLNAANDQWRAMLLLAINCGMGPTDIATLRLDELRGDIIANRRTKTGQMRIAPLWPETVAAIGDWMTLRTGDVPELFVTKYGNAWDGHDVGHGFKELRRAAGVDLGLNGGLYVLRHTFSTIADDCEQPNGKRLIMGQAFEGMDQVYVNKARKDISKLRLIVNHVRDAFAPLPGRNDPLAPRVRKSRHGGRRGQHDRA